MLGGVCSVSLRRVSRYVGIDVSQVGFDVEGRISAVVPKCVGTSLIQMDVTIKLSEDQWTAILQLWTNAKTNTCEFIVEEKEAAEAGVET